MIGPTMAGVVRSAMALTSCSRGLWPTTMMRPTGMIIAAPAPCRMRKSTSSPRLRDRPQSTEPSRNTAMAAMKIRRAPHRSAAQPDAGTTTAWTRM